MITDVADPPLRAPAARLTRGDFLAVVLLAIAAGTAVWLVRAHADPRFLALPAGNDVWFEADVPTVADRMLHRWADQSRNARHPLFPLLATVPAHLFQQLGLGEAVALRAVV